MSVDAQDRSAQPRAVAMSKRVDVSRLSVAECMALSKGQAEDAVGKELGVGERLEKIATNIRMVRDDMPDEMKTGLEEPGDGPVHRELQAGMNRAVATAGSALTM
eukprot:COSAG02_NODE_1127_length_14428_cov_68.304627_10_plen_105_part_00